MTKKVFSTALLFLILAVSLAITTPASAGFETYTVGSDGSKTAKDTFKLNETPYLYMKLPQDGFSVTASFWHAPSGGNPSFVSTGPDTTIERWISLPNWNSIKEAGKWSIDTGIFYSNGVSATSTASFAVTPEPLAVVLFLTGGLPIAVNLYRKKKHMAKV